MMTMISTTTGLISGPGVKFSSPEPHPPTNIRVRMPRVAPRPRTVMMIALAGRINEPNTRAISRKVASTM